MKILFDNNLPAYLLKTFPEATTAYRQGWQELANGKLLAAAEAAGFTLLITFDRGFATQQSFRDRSISVAILKPRNQSRESVMQVATQLTLTIDRIEPGEVIVVDYPLS